MASKGRVLLVGEEPGLVKELTPALTGREYELAVVPDPRQAALKIAEGALTAALVDLAKVSTADQEALGKLHKERGGFALVSIEAQAGHLSPAMAAPLRRLSWPFPQGFLDQVRAVEIPVVILIEPTLYITQGVQGALRQAGVQFFQLDTLVGVIDMMREQMDRGEELTKSKAVKAGLWDRLSGAAEEKKKKEEEIVFLGHVAAVRFVGTGADAVQFDARLRQTLPNAVCYYVSAMDPMRVAAAALAKGEPALVPREHARLLVDVLSSASDAGKAVAREREKERVLLVDNDMTVLSRLAESLLALGYDVVTALNGEEALKLAQQKPFQLAAIGGSALEATKLAGANLALKMRERDKDLRIILMVDQFPVQDALKGVSRAVELGLDDAILKPVDVSRMVLSVQRALERRFLIIENVRLLKEVQESARKLAQVNDFQTKFFAIVAHDVKNPLTAILGYSEILTLRLRERPDELRCATHIQSAAKTMNLLVSDLVDLAAIESGKLRVELGPLDLPAVITEVKSRVDVVAQQKKIDFSARIASNIPPLHGDPHRLGQVIQNLCTNAVQYTKEGGKVTIETAVRDGWVLVGVRDTGIGISKEDLPRVWERFFQTKEAQSMRKAGFGLGLKIAREIVQMHGGDMGIESELGVGSFFYFHLPIPKQ